MTSPPLAPLLTMSEGHLGVDDHPDYAYGACEAVCTELRAQRAALAQERARVAALEAERDAARKVSEIRRRMIDIPTAWELTLATPKDQHHEACSYRVAGMLCDCAAFRVMEHVSGLLRASHERAEALEASLTSARLAREEAEKERDYWKQRWDNAMTQADEGGMSAIRMVSEMDRLRGELDAAEAEARTLREALNPEALHRQVAGALKAAISAHGPVTADLVGSAAKRVIGQMIAALTPPAGEEQT